MSTFFTDLSQATEEREPKMLDKYSAFGGKMYKVKGATVWSITPEAAREAYKGQQAAGTKAPCVR